MTISSLSLLQTPRQAVYQLQKNLINAQTETATGRYADINLKLGSATARAIALRSITEQNTTLLETNTVYGLELKVTQTALESMGEISQKFITTLQGARNAVNGQEILKNAAHSALKSLTDLANTTHNGQALFGGIKTDSPPLNSYIATPSSAAKTAIDSAFFAQFGFNQTDPNVKNITATQLENFINTSYKSEFSNPSWGLNFSNAASENRYIRSENNLTTKVSTNLNEEGFRDLTQALIAAFDIGTGNLNQPAFEKLVDMTSIAVRNAKQKLLDRQTELGFSQETITQTKTRLQSKNSILTEEILHLETVDKYEVATRITSLTSQLEASYAITSRLSRLNLMNYLS